MIVTSIRNMREVIRMLFGIRGSEGPSTLRGK